MNAKACHLLAITVLMAGLVSCATQPGVAPSPTWVLPASLTGPAASFTVTSVPVPHTFPSTTPTGSVLTPTLRIGQQIQLKGSLQMQIDDRDVTNPNPISFFLQDGINTTVLIFPSGIAIPPIGQRVIVVGKVAMVKDGQVTVEVQSIQTTALPATGTP